MAGREYVLRVDLSSGTVRRERVPDRWRRQFIGGKGLGVRYLYDELDSGTDPLGPENLLAFCSGPLSGYLPGETRYAAVTKSPLTGAFLDSYAGGEFAAQRRRGVRTEAAAGADRAIRRSLRTSSTSSKSGHGGKPPARR
jgi:aldehyde:ferredoxin oxidoreductase